MYSDGWRREMAGETRRVNELDSTPTSTHLLLRFNKPNRMSTRNPFAYSVSHLLRALETFKALGIEFVSLSEQVDTSTPTGKMVFTVLGAVAELERSLIAERVRAGLRNARAKGKKLGRPRKAVDCARIAALRRVGRSWAAIGQELDVGGRVQSAGPCTGAPSHHARPSSCACSMHK